MRAIRFCAPFALAALLGASAAQAADTFLKSDDYKEGEEVVGKFFGDAEYGKIVEDIERNDVDFDWGWVKAEGKKANEPKNLSFDLSSYATVAIPEVPNHHKGLVSADTSAAVRDAFKQAMEQMGLKVVDSGADLNLDMAIVDYKEDSTFAYFANVKPFLELEVRLHDNKANEDLVLIRNQAHGDTPEVGARNFAEDFMRFLQ